MNQAVRLSNSPPRRRVYHGGDWVSVRRDRQHSPDSASQHSAEIDHLVADALSNAAGKTGAPTGSEFQEISPGGVG